MTGSNLVAVIVPIVAVLAMGVWLGLVFYAAAHPRWKRYDVLAGPPQVRFRAARAHRRSPRSGISRP